LEDGVSNLIDLIDRYIASWNETDVQCRRELIARTWTEDSIYADPLMRSEGLAEIEAMIAAIQARFPGGCLRRTSEVDTHENRVRFAWQLGPEHGPPLAGGVDFGVIVGERLQAIDRYIAVWNATDQPTEARSSQSEPNGRLRLLSIQ
jgi:hypothetical protein